MSDTDVEETPEPVVVQKKQSFLVPAIAAVILLAGGVFVGKMLSGGAAPVATVETVVVEKPEEGEVPEGDLVDLGEQFVNLADGHFLKVSVSVMYDTEVAFEIAEEAGTLIHTESHGKVTEEAPVPIDLAPTRDAVIEVLSELTVEDLSAADGRTMAKEHLLEEMRKLYREDLIVALYFSEFVWE